MKTFFYRPYLRASLPKDTAALAALAREIHPDLKLFETIVNENKKFKSTTPEGMRP
jgi:UDP-glucose 6-dehydrogenase